MRIAIWTTCGRCWARLTDPKLPKERWIWFAGGCLSRIFGAGEDAGPDSRIAEAEGRLVLLEYRGEDPKVPIRPEHKMTLEQVGRKLQPEGFRFDRSIEMLPEQHIIIFRR